MRFGAARVRPSIERYALHRDTVGNKIKLAELGERREVRTLLPSGSLGVSVATEERRERARACPFTDGHGSNVRTRE